MTLQRPAIDAVVPVPSAEEVHATSVHPSVAAINAMGIESPTIPGQPRVLAGRNGAEGRQLDQLPDYQWTPRRMCANATLSDVGSSPRPEPRAAFESGKIL